MVPQPQPAISKAQPAASPLRAYAVQKRWPLFVSIFGAVAVSLVLWAGIIFGVAVAIDWISGLFAS